MYELQKVFFAYLRFMYASKETFMKIGKDIVLAEPTDISTEIKVLQTFQEMC